MRSHLISSDPRQRLSGEQKRHGDSSVEGVVTIAEASYRFYHSHGQV